MTSTHRWEQYVPWFSAMSTGNATGQLWSTGMLRDVIKSCMSSPRSLKRYFVVSGGGWIDSPRVDLLFYIGAALVGWAALVAHVVFQVSAIALYFVWILFLDGPHLWATV